MYDNLFEPDYEWMKITDTNEIKNIINTYINDYYDMNDDKDTWFNKIKELAETLGYAANMKDYKKNPDNYKGNVADIATVIRVALTGKKNTPDLYEILRIFGVNRIKQRFDRI